MRALAWYTSHRDPQGWHRFLAAMTSYLSKRGERMTFAESQMCEKYLGVKKEVYMTWIRGI